MHDARIDATRAEFSVDHADLNRVLEHLVGLGVRTLTTSPPTLEELFLRHYGTRRRIDRDTLFDDLDAELEAVR